MESINDPWFITAGKALLLCVVLLGAFAYMTVIERKILGRMQHRMGPNRVGPFGLLQPIADAIKSVFKEDITVSAADKFVYYLAPFISIMFALTAFGAIPAGPAGSFFGLNPWVMDLDIGLLFVLAATSIGVYGIFLGGWASNSKFSLLGSLRSSAQMISYELGLGLSALTVVLIAGTLNFREIVEIGVWSVHPLLWIPLAISFVTFVISQIAEVNRTPLRPARSRAGDCSGLLDRVFFYQVGAVPDGGVHQHDDSGCGYQHALFGRLPWSRIFGRGRTRHRRVAFYLAYLKNGDFHVHVHLATGDPAALSLRPTDALRLDLPV